MAVAQNKTDTHYEGLVINVGMPFDIRIIRYLEESRIDHSPAAHWSTSNSWRSIDDNNSESHFDSIPLGVVVRV